jgi:hypothetical protein
MDNQLSFASFDFVARKNRTMAEPAISIVHDPTNRSLSHNQCISAVLMAGMRGGRLQSWNRDCLKHRLATILRRHPPRASAR